MSSKDLATWHIIKTNLDKTTDREVFFREKEVWWTSIGCNIGFEEDGKGRDFLRPVLVLYKFNSMFFYGVSLSTTKKTGKYYLYLEGRKDTALLSQMRALDAHRLKYIDGWLGEEDFRAIQKRLLILIAAAG